MNTAVMMDGVSATSPRVKASYLSVFSAAQLQALCRRWRFSFSKLIPWAARRARPLGSYVRRHRDGGDAQ